MTFISVQEDRFLTDVLKTWQDFFKSDIAFDGVKFLVKQPDKDVGFELPSIVLKRVSEETWKLSRPRGYFGNWNNTATEVNDLYGYTYNTMYQFDIYCTTIADINKYSSLVYGKLKSPDGSDVFADGRVSESLIPLKDFAPGGQTGTATNLRIKFRFRDDVEGAEISSFDPELHQFSISVSFWVDYLKEYTAPKITEISPTIEIEQI